MTEQVIKDLQNEKAELEKKLSDAVNTANGFSMKINAHNSFLSEVIDNSLETRTSLLNMSRALQDANQKLSSSQNLVAGLSSQLTTANTKITELEAKITELTPPVKTELELVESDKEQKSA